MRTDAARRKRGFQLLPEGDNWKHVEIRDPKLRQGRVVYIFYGRVKETGRRYGLKLKIESAPKGEWVDQQYLTFGKPMLVSRREFQRTIEYRKWKSGKWSERVYSMRLRDSSRTLKWFK